MSKLTGFNIANVERVKVETEEATPEVFVFETSNSASCTPAVSQGQEVEQRIKNTIMGLLQTDDIVKGYDIELEDQRFIPEMFALVDGGSNRSDGSAWTGYSSPVAGTVVTRKKFKLTLYTSDRDTDATANAYHAWVFTSCKGKGVPLTFADGTFASVKYSISSRPASGVSPFTVDELEELPAVT